MTHFHRASNLLPITQRVDGDIHHSNGTSVGPLLPQGWPRQISLSAFQIRMEYWHPTLARTLSSVNQSDSDEILGPHRRGRWLERAWGSPVGSGAGDVRGRAALRGWRLVCQEALADSVRPATQALLTKPLRRASTGTSRSGG